MLVLYVECNHPREVLYIMEFRSHGEITVYHLSWSWARVMAGINLSSAKLSLGLRKSCLSRPRMCIYHLYST